MLLFVRERLAVIFNCFSRSMVVSSNPSHVHQGEAVRPRVCYYVCPVRPSLRYRVSFLDQLLFSWLNIN